MANFKRHRWSRRIKWPFGFMNIVCCCVHNNSSLGNMIRMWMRCWLVVRCCCTILPNNRIDLRLRAIKGFTVDAVQGCYCCPRHSLVQLQRPPPLTLLLLLLVGQWGVKVDGWWTVVVKVIFWRWPCKIERFLSINWALSFYRDTEREF